MLVALLTICFIASAVWVASSDFDNTIEMAFWTVFGILLVAALIISGIAWRS